MSGLSIFKKNREDFKTLFTDTPLDVAALKATGTKNFLIQELEIKTSSGVNFLKINSKNKPKTYNNKIYRSWVQLLKSDIKEERVLGTRLIRYAYSQSGFKTNLNQFFTHIPHEALTSAGISEHIKTVQSDMKSLDLNAEFRSQMFRHNAKDKKIVPRISTKNIRRVGSHSAYFGFTYNPASESKNTIATGKNEQGFETFPEFISMKAASEGKESEKDVMLFKLVGLSKQEVSKNSMEDYTQVAEKEYKFMPTYARTYKLGAKYNNGSVVEYQYDESVNSSIIFENNLNTKQEEMLDAFMAEANAKGLFFRPDMMIPKTETLLSENKEVSLSESNEDEDWQTEENDCPMPIK
jgi:predicted DNA binding CopG/RHH family protein